MEDTHTLQVSSATTLGANLPRVSSSENIKQNGRTCSSPFDDAGRQRSPSPRFRHCSGSTTPTRTPTPTNPEATGAIAIGIEDYHLAPTTAKTNKSVSFHSHTNYRKDRKIQSGKSLWDVITYTRQGLVHQTSLSSFNHSRRSFQSSYCLHAIIYLYFQGYINYIKLL